MHSPAAGDGATADTVAGVRIGSVAAIGLVGLELELVDGAVAIVDG